MNHARAAAAAWDHRGGTAVPIPQELKDILACPKCKGALEFHDDRDEIRCLRCKLAYPVRDGIPVMLVEEARPLP